MKKQSTELQLKKELSPIAEEAQSLRILDPASLKHATEILSKLNKYNDQIESEESKVLTPLKEAMKAEKARWAPLKDMYKEAIGLIRLQMTRYQTERVEEVLEETEAITARIAPGKGHLTLETAVKKLEAIPTIDKTTSTDEGSVTFVETKRFEVVDISLLPLEYHLPDEVLIRKAMKEGKELPGVRYWTEQTPRNIR